MALTWESEREDVGVRRLYSPVGKCIYCGESGCTLTDEHPVPNALGGRQILPKASCESCQRIINEEVEQYCISTLLGSPRAYFDLKSRKRPARPQSLHVQKVTGEIARISVDPDKAPLVVALPCFPPAAILEDKLPTATFQGTLWALVPPDEAYADLEAHSFVSATVDPGKFARFLAKIAYSYAVASFGLGSFSSRLPDIILGKNLLFTEFVGGHLGPFPRDVSQVLKMGIVEFERSSDSHRLSAVQIQLFPSISGPEYVVVLGSAINPVAENGALSK